MRRIVLTVALVVIAAACDWPQFLGGPQHTGSTADTSITRLQVASGSLTMRWRSSTTGATYGAVQAVANGLAFAPRAGGGISAFDADGVTGCTGTPTVCTPLWTYPAALADPAVSDGILVASSTSGGLAAFDATGATGCGGSPKLCSPLWTTAPDGATTDTPTVAGGLVYRPYFRTQALGDAGIAVYDLTGDQGCSSAPKVCEPLWRSLAQGETRGAASVAGGIAYVVTGSRLWAFDATGTTPCGGTPRVCLWRWSAPLAGGALNVSPPVLQSGRVFVTSAGLGETRGYDAAGQDGCSGTPTTCTFTWRAAGGATLPAASSGKVYVRNGAGVIGAYDAAGQEGCTGSGVAQCSPVQVYEPHPFQCNPPGPCDTFTLLVIVNGVLYAGYGNPGGGDVTAYDATGDACSPFPPNGTFCPAIRSYPTGFAGIPIVANGFLYTSWSAPANPGVQGFQALAASA